MEAESTGSNATPVPAAVPGSRPKGIVTPHPLKWHQRLAASLIYGLIRLVAATLRYRWAEPPEISPPETRPFVYCIWHNRLPLCLVMYRHYLRRMKQPMRVAAIVSASKDGGVVARILEHFGVQPVRGSTSRRGPQALLELTTWAERGYDLAITPDGPRGPCYVLQPGAISLAQITGRSILPVSYHLSWKIRLKSWDRFQIPLPFGRITMRFGDPIPIPRDASESEREALRVKVENALKAITAD